MSDTQSQATTVDVTRVDNGLSSTYKWLERAAASGVADVERAARTLMDYYQGAESEEKGGAGPLALPKSNDGKEQDAFESWAAGEKYDMTTHPLHWLFLNERTYAARQGWKAALEYVGRVAGAAQAAPVLNDHGYKLVNSVCNNLILSGNGAAGDFVRASFGITIDSAPPASAQAKAPGGDLSDDECDRIAAQAMDGVAATQFTHALHLDPNVTSNNDLRRALVRAGAKHGTVRLVIGADMSALIAAAEKVVLDALDNVRGDAHVCDQNVSDVVVGLCSMEIRALYDALKALRASTQQGAGATTVQWRNILKTVRELAKFCFGGPSDQGSVTLGAAYTSLVNALTAKDGLAIHLEPLPVCADLPADASTNGARYKAALQEIAGYRGKGDCSTDVIEIAESALDPALHLQSDEEGGPSNA